MRAPSIETRTYLMTLSMFHDLERSALERISAGTTKIHLEKGQYLYRRGDACHGFHTVIYGHVKLSVVGRGGTEKVIDVARAGEAFDKATMFTDAAYPACAQAVSDTMLLHVDAGTLMAEIERTPRLARMMLAGLGRRVLGLLSDVESYSLRSGIQRLVEYLLTHREPAREAGEHVLPDIRKNHLASLLNLTPEHLSRMLGELARDGLVSVAGADIRILDRDGLTAIVER